MDVFYYPIIQNTNRGSRQQIFRELFSSRLHKFNILNRDNRDISGKRYIEFTLNELQKL